MEYTQQFSIYNFPFWSGAKDRVESWKEEIGKKAEENGGKDYMAKSEFLDAMQSYIEEVFYDQTPSESEKNDLVWFEMDDWYQEYINENFPEDEEEDEED